MKTKKLWNNIFVMCVAMLSLVSCSDEKDGDWDPMDWNTEVPVVTNEGNYVVSADGGTLTFICRNYSKPWFSYANENGKNIFPPYMDIDYALLYSENFRAEIHGNKLTVDFKANETSQIRNTAITVTAGDIFYTFRFKQSANSKAD